MGLVVGIMGLLAGLAIASLVLSISCRMIGVEPPDLFPGMVMCLLVILVQGVLELIVVAAIGFGAGLTDVPTPEQALDLAKRALLIAIPLNILVTAALYSVMLQNCSFGKGLLLWLVQLLVLIAFGAAIVLVFYGLTLKA
jgi:hypothetical protein